MIDSETRKSTEKVTWILSGFDKAVCWGGKGIRGYRRSLVSPFVYCLAQSLNFALKIQCRIIVGEPQNNWDRRHVALTNKDTTDFLRFWRRMYDKSPT